MSQLFPHSALLALQAVLYITETGSYESPIKGQQIESEFKLNPRALEAILRKLVQQGILQARSGATGGYYMSASHPITLEQVVRPFLSLPNKNHFSHEMWVMQLMPALQEASDAFMQKLASTNIRDLLPAPAVNFEI